MPVFITILPIYRLPFTDYYEDVDSLKDLLITKNLDEPTEVTALRDYVQNLYGYVPEVRVSQKTIAVVVPNSKMASELRLREHEITRRCQLTKRLFIKIESRG